MLHRGVRSQCLLAHPHRHLSVKSIAYDYISGGNADNLPRMPRKLIENGINIMHRRKYMYDIADHEIAMRRAALPSRCH